MAIVSFDPALPLRVRLTLKSVNRKTGPIPVTMTSASTCPTNCSWRNNGCYAMNDFIGLHWSKTPHQGLKWREFCRRIAKLPEGQLWRHNEAGDLPGTQDEIDTEKLAQLVRANAGRSGFTYTHKPATPSNLRAIKRANRMGFAINFSADSPEQADALAELGAAPVTMVVPKSSPRFFRTPAGRRGVVCPAQERPLTCLECKLCAVPSRKSIIGFRAHGNYANRITDQLVQLRLF